MDLEHRPTARCQMPRQPVRSSCTMLQERKGVQLQADSEETLSDLHQTLTVCPTALRAQGFALRRQH